MTPPDRSLFLPAVLPRGAMPDAAYDVVVCGAGSSGSVVARRLADRGVRVLLIEAGGLDDVPSVNDPALWATNLGSERDWGFVAEASPHVNGRRLSMSMGRVLGGGSSVNVCVWAQGHRSDWEYFAREARDEAWGPDAVRAIYRRMEDWQGKADPHYRGTGGPVHVAPSRYAGPIAEAMFEAAATLGIPRYDSPNGAMMEGDGGCAVPDTLIHDGRRQSIFRSYVQPLLAGGSITVMTDTDVSRVLFQGLRATGVEFVRDGTVGRVTATAEVVLSLGAINTPRVLMHSGIGARGELSRHGIGVVADLPGVGCNLQDHVSFNCTWEYREPIAPGGTGNNATLFWKTRPELESPDLLFCQVEFPVPSAENAALGTPEHGWSMFAGLARPHSRGRVSLVSSNPLRAPRIEANMLQHELDIEAARACVALAREIGNAAPYARYVRREAMPGALHGEAMDDFIRNAAVTYWHQSGTAKMGYDEMSVVDGQLRVHGLHGLRIADASIMPRVATGNTQAPSAVIGERAADCIIAAHGL